MNSKEMENVIDMMINSMSEAEINSFIPLTFRKLAVKGFLAGSLGPKKHKKNNWLTSDLKSSDVLPSMRRHIDQSVYNYDDPDTGLPNSSHAFLAARVVMYTVFRDREIQGKIKLYSDSAATLPPKPLC